MCVYSHFGPCELPRYLKFECLLSIHFWYSMCRYFCCSCFFSEAPAPASRAVPGADSGRPTTAWPSEHPTMELIGIGVNVL